MKKQKHLPRIIIKVTGKQIPQYQSALAAGCDLYADIKKPITIKPGTFCCVPAGIAIEIPPGYEAQVRPRSGLAFKNGIGVLNSPGTIDADYRGEIKVILFNFSRDDFAIKPGDRIAQLIFSPIVRAHFIKVERLGATERGQGGFGHTGMKETPHAKRSTPHAKK
ncbi:deoxyuridine 5'-triphosphate nucleotidohydrolase [candidate division WOR-3 bacterium RBG_13_43_14]|uniref:Deoxyuridine 5'-triphosphate nucleotidohydrolase n=1 Tax=candidate division WOR-3 bacterium RBG_13_43_14 TaxID=1802590 RepID=A0A1F4U908_UNCW3|nr:MAG: deoxyuridine 5'-triphosphate nucleotidohydrolase [candidate division WOR-3 bacterium RBG_13_43_14]